MLDIRAVGQRKARNAAWGKQKISAHLAAHLSAVESRSVTKSKAQQYCEAFFFDIEEDCLFYKSTELHEIHWR